MTDVFSSESALRPGASDAAQSSEVNRQRLYALLELIGQQVELALGAGQERTRDNTRAGTPAPAALAKQVAAAASEHTGLAALVDLFGLSSFERDVLLLAAAPKLIPDFFSRFAGAARPKSPELSFELAFRTLNAPHWSAITPGAPLRRYHLIQLDRPDDPVQSPLRIDERMLFFLLGLSVLDARLEGLLEPVSVADGDLPAEYAGLVEQVGAVWSAGNPSAVIQLAGPDPEGKREIACAGAASAGLALYLLRGSDAQCEASQRVSLAHLVDRELRLSCAALLVIVDDDDGEEARAVRALVSRLSAPVLLARREPLAGLLRREVRLDLESLDPKDQRRLWRACLGPRLGQEQDQILDRIIGHFRFGPSAIRATSAALAANKPGRQSADALWEACRRRGRSRLSDLAQRIESNTGWDDLVLPGPQKQLLHEIADQLAHTTMVHERWGFGRRGARGLGLTALFSGDSGTGKTLAAEVIANQLHLDLWRVDLSRMLDKYIGETEKNLRRIFDAAEETGAILLFDEADALFSKRSEVKDSVDRFANVEVAYLLQRMETYGGLAILTTNLRGALDSAFLRRIRFVVQFPFPGHEQRALIWSRAFPPTTPTAGLDLLRLAQLSMTGGSIKNMALNGAFLAAAQSRAVGMDHLLHAARGECAKVERTLAAAEIAGWT